MTAEVAQRKLRDLMLPYQKAAIENPARFCCHNWSRQVGKSFALTFRRILRGIARGRDQIFLSAGARQSRELMMKTQQHLRAMEMTFRYSEENYFEGTDYRILEIKLPEQLGGIRIIGLPANPNTARGYTGDVLLDEFAMHKQDQAIWDAVYASVLRGEGEIDVASTPKGRQNMFYRLKSNEAFDYDKVTILDAVEAGLDVDVEMLRKGCGSDESWRQEFMCEFLDETTAFLTYEMIGECEDQLLPYELNVELLHENKADLYCGIDLARKKDLTVIWVFQKHGRTLFSCGLIELRSMTFRQQIEMISEVLNVRSMRRACVDATGLGMQMAEELQESFGSHRVEACTFTNAFKSQIAGDLRVKVEDHNFRIPCDVKLSNDLHSIRKIVTAAGNIRLDAPRSEGSHADRFWAGALAVHAASDDVGPIEATFGQDLAAAGARGW